MYGTRFSADLGCCTLVLGELFEWTLRHVYSALVDLFDRLAARLCEFPVCLCDALWTSRVLSPDSAQSSSLFQNAVTSQACSLVPGVGGFA